MGLYVEVQYGGDWWGKDPLVETAWETPGALYRSLAGIDKSRPWEALGRCTGKAMLDIAGSPCMFCGFARDEHERGPVIASHGHWYQATSRQVGWVFVARTTKVNRGDTQPTGLREAWVTVFTAPPTVTTVEHYAPFGGRP